MNGIEAREKILNIYNRTDKSLPEKVKKYLKEEIDEFDRHSNKKTGEGYWNDAVNKEIDELNPNNILIFFLLGRAKKPISLENHNWQLNDPPDIDVDFESRDRDNVLQYLKEKYGEKRVLPIGTIGTLKIKMAIQDIARVLGIPPSEVFPVTTSMKDVDEKMTLEEMRRNYSKLDSFLTDHPEVIDHIEKITGCYRHYCLSGEMRIVCYLKEYNTLQFVKIKDLIKEQDKYSLFYVDDIGNKSKTDNYSVVCSGIQTIYEIEMEDGSILECTEEHKWYTNQGIKSIKDFDSDTRIRKISPF